MSFTQVHGQSVQLAVQASLLLCASVALLLQLLSSSPTTALASLSIFNLQVAHVCLEAAVGLGQRLLLSLTCL